MLIHPAHGEGHDRRTEPSSLAHVDGRSKTGTWTGNRMRRGRIPLHQKMHPALPARIPSPSNLDGLHPGGRGGPTAWDQCQLLGRLTAPELRGSREHGCAEGQHTHRSGSSWHVPQRKGCHRHSCQADLGETNRSEELVHPGSTDAID